MGFVGFLFFWISTLQPAVGLAEAMAVLACTTVVYSVTLQMGLGGVRSGLQTALL